MQRGVEVCKEETPCSQSRRRSTISKYYNNIVGILVRLRFASSTHRVAREDDTRMQV